jgi:hypothetical protein
MADSERIEMQLDLSQATESAKQLGAALQTTKVDATAFSAALTNLDDVGLVPLGELELALERLGPSGAKATAAATDFIAALDKLIAQEALVEAETRRLADEALNRLAAAEAKAAEEAKRLQADALDLVGSFKATKNAAKEVGDTYEVLAVSGQGYELAARKLTTAEEVAASTARRLADAEAAAAAETARMTALFKPAAVSLDEVAAAANREHAALVATTTQMASAGGGTRNLGQALLTASFATQDFTSQLGTRGLGGALGAIQNNIPMLLVGLGVGAGLTGVLSVLSIGAGAVYDNWDKIATLWRDGETLREAERQKELAKSIDSVREATEKQLATPSAEALKPGGDLAKAIKEFGGDQVRKELEKAYREQFGDFGDDHTKQAVTDIIGGVQKGDAQSRRLLDQMTDSTFINRDSEVMRRLRGEKSEQQQQADAEAARKKFDADNAAQVKAANDKEDAARKTISDIDDAMGKLAEQHKKDEKTADKVDLKKLELPQGPEAPEKGPRMAAQAAGRGMASLEQQAADLANQMQMGQMMGFDTSGLQQSLDQIQAAWLQQRQQLLAAQDQLNKLGFQRFTPWRGGRP